MQTINRKSKTLAQKFLSIPNAELFLNLLSRMGSQNNPPVENAVVKSPKLAPKPKPAHKSSPAMIVVKGFNASTNEHERAEIPASKIVGLSFADAIATVRNHTFPSAAWSLNIRIPKGL